MKKMAFGLIGCLASLLFCIEARSQDLFENEIRVIVNTLGSKLNNLQDTRTIAIADFTNIDGKATNVDKFITDRFLNTMVSFNGSFKVVDRSRVNSLLKEAGLSAKGLLDPDAATKLGRLKSIDVVVVGTVVPDGNDLRLTVRAIRLESAVVVGTAEGEITKTSTIKALGEKADTADNASAGHGTDKLRTPAKQVTEVNGFTAELSGCRQSGSTIECLMTITSKGKDADLGVNPYISKIIDANDGFEFKMSHVRLGNLSSDNMYIVKNLVADYPVMVTCTFSPVTRPVKKIARLDLGVGDLRTITFRNILVEQQ